jgi:hypothetical protein
VQALKAYERALGYRSSPQQRIRLLLRLGELREAAGLDAGALELYESLLSDFPDYPDRLTSNEPTPSKRSRRKSASSRERSRANDQLTHSHWEGSVGSQSDDRVPRTIRKR